MKLKWLNPYHVATPAAWKYFKAELATNLGQSTFLSSVSNYGTYWLWLTIPRQTSRLISWVILKQVAVSSPSTWLRSVWPTWQVNSSAVLLPIHALHYQTSVRPQGCKTIQQKTDTFLPRSKLFALWFRPVDARSPFCGWSEDWLAGARGEEKEQRRECWKLETKYGHEEEDKKIAMNSKAAYT